MYIMSKMASYQETTSEIHHYERLEFLGDAVIEFLSRCLVNLFRKFCHLLSVSVMNCEHQHDNMITSACNKYPMCVLRLEVCTGMGMAGIPRNPLVSRGYGSDCCGNTAGMDLAIAGFPRG